MVSLFTVALCGVVVTYVASANNWKAEYQDLNNSVDSIKKALASEKRQATEQVAQAQEVADQLREENNQLNAQLSAAQNDLADAQRQARLYNQRVSDSTGTIAGLQQTIESLRTSLSATQQDLTNKTGQLASAQKKLNEINTELDEKIVELQTLEIENKKLLEIKSDLEQIVANKATSGTVSPVTTSRGNARVVSAQPSGAKYSQADLKARITEVDLRNKLATISIGAADGVSTGMRFHITRGNQFIADMVITHVDQERAAGVLELVQSTPTVGDNASLNL